MQQKLVNDVVLSLHDNQDTCQGIDVNSLAHHTKINSMRP